MTTSKLNRLLTTRLSILSSHNVSKSTPGVFFSKRQHLNDVEVNVWQYQAEGCVFSRLTGIVPQTRKQMRKYLAETSMSIVVTSFAIR